MLPQAYEDQASLVRVAQAQVEACEDELASRAAELEALQVGCSCHGLKKSAPSVSHRNADLLNVAKYKATDKYCDIPRACTTAAGMSIPALNLGSTRGEVMCPLPCRRAWQRRRRAEWLQSHKQQQPGRRPGRP